MKRTGENTIQIYRTEQRNYEEEEAKKMPDFKVVTDIKLPNLERHT